jgi:hypothetical protein
MSGDVTWDGKHYTPDEIRLLSVDPSADPDLLAYLVSGYSPAVVYDQLARNPALPIFSLLWLIAHHTRAVLNNPAFRLQMAVNPGFLDRLSISARVAIVGCSYTDTKLIRHLAARRNRPVRVRASAAINPSTPPDMLRDFVRHDWRVRAALALNPLMPVDLQLKLAQDPKNLVRCNLAGRHDLLEKTVESLVSVTPDPVDAPLLKNPTVTEDVRERIYVASGCGNPGPVARLRGRYGRILNRRY